MEPGQLLDQSAMPCFRPGGPGRVIRAGMRKLTILLGVCAWVATVSVAQAEDKKAKADAKGGDGVSVDSNGVRHDPKGVKGISPYLEQINKGDRAYIARDFDGAIAAYREAIKTDPEKALGHYR